MQNKIVEPNYQKVVGILAVVAHYSDRTHQQSSKGSQIFHSNPCHLLILLFPRNALGDSHHPARRACCCPPGSIRAHRKMAR